MEKCEGFLFPRATSEAFLFPRATSEGFLFPRATSEGFLLCTSSAGLKLRVPAGCRRAAGGLPVGCRCIEKLGKPKENRCFFPRATSEGFLLCTSSAGLKLRVPAGCRRAAGGLPVGCRCIEKLGKPKENRCFLYRPMVRPMARPMADGLARASLGY